MKESRIAIGLKDVSRRKRRLRWMWFRDGRSATVLLNQYLLMGRGNTRPRYDVVMVAAKRAESDKKDP